MGDDGISIELALAFLARQQMLATAMQFAVNALNDPAKKDQAVSAIRVLADTAESDAEGVGDMGAAYAEGLRRYALILETNQDPDGSGGDFPFAVIQGGKDNA